MAKEQVDINVMAAFTAKVATPSSGGLHPPALPSDGTPVTLDFGDGADAQASVAPPPLPGAQTADPTADPGDGPDGTDEQPRRSARRRPSGPAARTRFAANDDAPTIGGLIFALEQKPSNRPYQFAAVFSVIWALIGVGIGGIHFSTELAKGISVAALLISPQALTTFAVITMPIGIVWFLALLAWRSEELRLRSSTMTEVAVRLAEPDRMAEQSIASLGQNVRRQVAFMNDAVSRALGRAGELEALVKSEVMTLERSYDENERRIRGLIQELSGERHALLNTSERVAVTLRTLGSEVPALIDNLADQQLKLGDIITAAGSNLNSLESAITQSAGQLETTLGSRTTHLQRVLDTSSSRIEVALLTHQETFDKTLDASAGKIATTLSERSGQMQDVLENYSAALATVLSARSDEMQAAFDEQIRALDGSLGNRTENLQIVFEEYARALDTTLENRAQALDLQLVERTTALDSAFTERLQLFDDSIRRSAVAIDGAVNERSAALTTALDAHAKVFRETIARQAGEIDESLMHGISSVRRSSENITKQSLKAIEGLASQSEMLRNVSENLLGQINSVTNRFEMQGQNILKAANALETTNFKIDNTLQARHSDLSRTLDRISGSADDLGKYITQYSSTIEGTVSEAEKKARQAAEDLRAATEQRSRVALAQIEQLAAQSATQGERALEDLRKRFTSASGDVAQEIGSLSSQLDDVTSALRTKSAQAANEIAQEQLRLRAQLDGLPQQTRATAENLRSSLHEQLMALDQLQGLANRTALNRDVSPPMGAPPPASGPMPGFPPGMAMGMQPGMQPGMPPAPGAPGFGSAPGYPSGDPRALQTLPSRDRPTAPADRWSFGVLLARASHEDEPVAGFGSAGHSQEPFALNVQTIARALDPAAADAIWTRMRRGERGIMARSIYTPDGRVAYDEINRRVKTDPGLQDMITQFLANFERILRDAEARDPTGQVVQQNLVSDNGRVYLFLAHASGRLV